ncbi:MAG: hypothetical protein KF851_19535 [Pirellulaceae bacterium]|nr:hypothetical protein [Pirellulaceae bacterium]
MTNPFQPPSMHGSPLTQAPSADVATVISSQKMLIYSILGYLCAIPFIGLANAFLEGPAERPTFTLMFVVFMVGGFLVAFTAAICAAIAIYRMGSVLFPGSTRIIYTIGEILPIPFVGLLVMLSASQNATGYLRAQNIKVGFFGAKT